jgi:putative DNA primase/helicase
MENAKKPFHETVAERLIEQLKEGTAPWQKPWQPGEPNAFLPMNPITGKRYKGINAIHLMSQGRNDLRWMTYKQAASAGAQVRKGEKGTPIQFWKFSEEQDKLDDNGKPVLDPQGKPVKATVMLERPRVFFATVFNAEQIDGLPPIERKTGQSWDAVERAEHILNASGARIMDAPGDRAFYRPSTDSITMPARDQFQTADRYYATALHELGHWTGHSSRLGRDLSHPFGSEGYAKEELRAEIASMILGDEVGIGHDPGQHAAYVGSWIKALQDDPLEIFRASSEAEKIHDYVLAFEQKQVQEQGKEPAHELALIQVMQQEQEVNMQQPPQHATAAAPDVAEGWTLDHLERGTLSRALESANRVQIERVAKVLDAMYPLNTQNDFWMRHTLPYDVDAMDTKIERANTDVEGRRFDAVIADARKAGDFAAMDAAADDALGFTLPHDWNGRIQVQGNVSQIIDGEEVVEPAATRGIKPQFWSVYAQHESGMYGWLADFDKQEQAELLAERLAIIDAYSEANEHEKAAKLARINEQRVRRDPSSTKEDISAAREARKDAESAAMLNDADLQRRIVQYEREQQAVVSGATQKPDQGRVYLAVPYSERAEAKAAGAQWDRLVKSWYAGPKADMAKLDRWKPDNVSSRQEPAMTPRDEFAEALRSAGCVVNDNHPIMDGKKHRISVIGEKPGVQSGSGFYVGHLDGHPAGYIKNNKTGVELKWKAKGYVLDSQQKAHLQAEAARKLQAREAEQAKLQEQAAQRVGRQIADLVPVVRPTPYMQAKGIAPQPGVFTDRAGEKTYIPATDVNDKQWTMQYIQEDGTKRFAKGSRKEGCFHVVGGGSVDALAKVPALVIGEGYATASSLAKTLGFATVAAFDSGNLVHVAKALREKYPDKPIVIAGDDDKHLELTHGINPGRNKAREAANAVGGKLLMPIFAPGEQSYPAHLDPVTPEKYRSGELSDEQNAALSRMKEYTDFNDVATRSALGREGLGRQVRAVVDNLVERHAARVVEERQLERTHRQDQRARAYKRTWHGSNG